MTHTPFWRGLLPSLNTVGYRGDRNTLQTPDKLSGRETLQQGRVIRVRKSGAVFDNIDFRVYTVVLDEPVATFQNCLFDSSGPDWAAIRAPLPGLTVEDCTFDGGKSPSGHAGFIANPLNWKTGKTGGPWFIRRSVFRGSGSDMIHAIAGGVIEDCVFHGGGYAKGAHFDVIYSNHLVEPLTIRRNVFDMKGDGGQPGNPGNNCIRLMSAPSEGPLGSVSKAGVLVTNNLLLGNGLGAYLIHVLKSTEKVSIVANLCDESRYGMLYPLSDGQVVYWSRNYNSENGEEIVPKGVTFADAPPPEEPPPPLPPVEPPPPPPAKLPNVSVESVTAGEGGAVLVTLKLT